MYNGSHRVCGEPVAMRRTPWPAASCHHDNKLDSVYYLLMQMPITYYVFAIGGKVHHGKQIPAYYCRKGGRGVGEVGAGDDGPCFFMLELMGTYYPGPGSDPIGTRTSSSDRTPRAATTYCAAFGGGKWL